MEELSKRVTIDLRKLEMLREQISGGTEAFLKEIEKLKEKSRRNENGAVIEIHKYYNYDHEIQTVICFMNPNNLKEMSEMKKIYNENYELKEKLRKMKKRNIFQRIFNR